MSAGRYIALAALAAVCCLVLAACSPVQVERVDSSSSASAPASAPSASSSASGSPAAGAALPGDALLSPQEFYDAAMDAAGDGATVIDARPYAQYKTVAFSWESTNIPTGQIEVRAREVLECGSILLLAQNDPDTADAWAAIEETGYPMDKVRALSGGAEGWASSGMPAGTMQFNLPAC